ncbi:hypothetical protein GCM10022377_26010 [Zhihengliuella alba]|uniref:DUF2267 domain-containing protein n=1 Tax=Zhihengliuella alba TaxID=547018 RepID=A0ABP7DYA8_9MICC
MPIVGVMADPGLPEIISRQARAAVEENLAEFDRDGWTVVVERGALPLTGDGDIPLMERSSALLAERDWDYIIYVTDLPRTYEGQPLAYELENETNAALLSLPALGFWRLTARLRTLLTDLALTLHERQAPEDERRASNIRTPGVRTAHHEDHDGRVFVTLDSPVSRLRLLAGMIRNNRPGRLLTALSTCIATAAAAGAFGIFYTSIWNMSDALPSRRLLLISVVAVLTLSIWLIVRNNLWTRSASIEQSGTARVGVGSASNQAALDNTATVITVVLSVAFMYAVLFTVLFAGSITIVDAGYLESQLEHPVGVGDYATLSWLAASLGTMAGSLGSNFDSDAAIREATYSRRARQRRQLNEEAEEHEAD